MVQRYEGKAKVIEQLPESADRVRITFKDDISAGNRERLDNFAGKGSLCGEISNLLFEYLREQGIDSHYLGRESDNVFLARRLEIVMVEVVVRNRTAGSICRRLGVEQGRELQPPLVEFFLKDDDLGDPLITRDHIRILALATPAELDEMSAQALRVNEALAALFARAGLELVDFKLEFGRERSGCLLLADEISPDTCRLWIDGRSLDKDIFRRGEGSPLDAYREVLRRIKPLLSTEAGK